MFSKYKLGMVLPLLEVWFISEELKSAGTGREISLCEMSRLSLTGCDKVSAKASEDPMSCDLLFDCKSSAVGEIYMLFFPAGSNSSALPPLFLRLPAKILESEASRPAIESILFLLTFMLEGMREDIFVEVVSSGKPSWEFDLE
mgnify:CR=1 FL=1